MADPEGFTKFVDVLDRAGMHVPRKLAVEIWNMLSDKESSTIDCCLQILEVSPDLATAKEAMKKFKAGIEHVKA